jgi:lysozyme family protein
MADFNLAIPVVLNNEGGYVSDPNDPGGETNFGISKASYPNVDIKNLTVAEATAIYLRDLWLFGGIVVQAVATKLFDSYVNERHDAIKIAQRIVGVDVDGSYGPHTEAAINGVDPAVFLAGFRSGLITHYEAIVAAHPSEAEFLNGWLRRARQ